MSEAKGGNLQDRGRSRNGRAREKHEFPAGGPALGRDLGLLAGPLKAARGVMVTARGRKPARSLEFIERKRGWVTAGWGEPSACAAPLYH